MCVCPTVGTGVWFWSSANVVCIQCPVGWTVYYGHCYYVNTNPMSWNNAWAWCLSQGADFMEVRNQNEYNLLYNFYIQYANGGNLWVIKIYKTKIVPAYIPIFKIGAAETISQTVFDFRWTHDNSSLSQASSWWCNGKSLFLF